MRVKLPSLTLDPEGAKRRGWIRTNTITKNEYDTENENYYPPNPVI